MMDMTFRKISTFILFVTFMFMCVEGKFLNTWAESCYKGAFINYHRGGGGANKW